jgi:hypothetical protein
MPGVAGGAQAVGAVHPERDKSGRHAWRVTIDTNGGMNQEIHMDTSKATHTPDERTTAPLYPYGMTVHITYTDHTDVQQRAAWRRIWAWVMTPTTAGTTAGNAS